MKTIRFVIAIMAILSGCLSSYSQNRDNTVTLIVSGDGPTKDEAIKHALRNAIEQTYGAFVSADTEVLDDEIIRDEIVTISTGNVLGYSEINALQNPDDSFSVIVEATVSIGNLTNFAKSKGMSVDISTGPFIMNMKIRELNKKNEFQAIKDLRRKLILMSNNYNFFDYDLKIGEPYMSNGMYAVKATIRMTPNENLAIFMNTIISTLKSLALTDLENKEYMKANLGFNIVEIHDFSSNEEFLNLFREYVYKKSSTIYLRNNEYCYPNLDFGMIILNNQLKGTLIDNLGNELEIGYIDEDSPKSGRFSGYYSEYYPLISRHVPEWIYNDFNFDGQYKKRKERAYSYYVKPSVGKVRCEKFQYFYLDDDFEIGLGTARQKHGSGWASAPAEFILELSYPEEYFGKLSKIELNFKNPIEYK